MIVTHDFGVRVGAHTLFITPDERLRVQSRDRIGPVRRNDADKTTTMHILSGETELYDDLVVRPGPIGYLP